MLKTLHISDICKAALVAEQTGNYESGLIELVDFWDYRQPDISPNTYDLSKNEIGSLLLRCGALYGYYGTSKKDIQEKSLNLITEAWIHFSSIPDNFKVRECANYLAIAYSRLGNKDNTETWLNVCFDSKEIDSLYLLALVTESIININWGQNEFVVDRLITFQKQFFLTKNLFLKSNFFSSLGLAKKNLGCFDESLENLLVARDLFGNLNHKPYLASLENNLARLYQKQGDLDTAIKFAIKALNLSEEIGDLHKTGGICDTLAQIFFQKRIFSMALHYADKAVESLEKTEFHSYLIEALETKMSCLIRLGRVGDALDVYTRTMRIAETQTDQSICSRLKGSFVAATNELAILKFYREGGNLTFVKDLSLTLDESIEFENELIIVETTSNRSKFLGIEAGDLLVVDSGEYSEGDLIAVLTVHNLVYTGYFFKDELNDKNMLHSPNGVEWLEFDISGEGKPQNLGRVVGKARFRANFSKSLHVEPIVLNNELPGSLRQ